MQNVRAAAAIALTAVVRDGKAFTGALDDPSLALLEHGDSHQVDPRDRALFREICFGTLRHYFLLQALLAPFLRKPLGKKDTDVKLLLMLGLYQIIFLRTPDHAALNATVDACKGLKKPWAKGLLNAVLRNYLRQCAGKSLAEQCTEVGASDEAASHSHPGWLLQQLQRDWPEHWRQLVAYNNAQPPMSIRVNLAQCTREHYRELLTQQGIASQPCALAETGIILDQAVDVVVLPHFEQAWASVQDSGAQLAARLLDAQPGERVLDACAAPGGKSAHILQHCDNLQLTALDVNPARLELVRSNIQRCIEGANENQAPASSAPVQLQCADAAELHSWWDGQCFGKILLDAPCSGSGVISHHPDIKLLRRASDSEAFAAQQMRLLEALWPALAVGGSLLYCTCSVNPVENSALIRQFMDRTATARLEPLPASWGVDTGAGHQLLPNTGKNGGFFYAKLSKSAAI